MRRKPGSLLPLELSILDAAIATRMGGTSEFHGFLIASEVKGRADTRSLTAYGTLYKALERMEKAGFLTSRWEEPAAAELENRPRRRLYTVTLAGEEALARAQPSPLAGEAAAEAAR